MGVLSTKDPLAEWLGTTDTNCPLGTTTDTSFYLLIHSYNHTLHNISLGSVFLFNRPCLSLCLFISLTLTTWSIRSISSRSSLFSYSLLSVNSLFFLKKKFIFYFNTLHNLYLFFNFCLNVGKQWKRGETLNLYLGFFRFPVLYLNFSSCRSCDCQINYFSLLILLLCEKWNKIKNSVWVLVASFLISVW